MKYRSPAAAAASFALLKNTLMAKQNVMVAMVNASRSTRMTVGSEWGVMPPP